MAAARDTAVAILSYQPDTVETDLNTGAKRLTGAFRDEYTSMINKVVIPNSKEKQITAMT